MNLDALPRAAAICVASQRADAEAEEQLDAFKVGAAQMKGGAARCIEWLGCVGDQPRF